MPSSSYIKFTGQRSGTISGPSTNKSHAHEWPLTSFTHEVSSPRDPQSGLPTGRRQHHAVVVTLPLATNIPILWSVLVNNENLSNVVLSFISNGPDGQIEDVYKITLTNANISDIIEVASGSTPAFQISMTYQRIEWETTGGVSVFDDWESRA